MKKLIYILFISTFLLSGWLWYHIQDWLWKHSILHPRNDHVI